MTDELWRSPATELAARIASGEISAREVVQAHLDRIDDVNERIRAVVRRFDARTNLPDMGVRLHTDSALHGPTINPWDAARTPGGSSGGEAAAVATGMSPLGLGRSGDHGHQRPRPLLCDRAHRC